MAVDVLARAQLVAAPIEDAFAFYAEPHNLERITPRWLRFRIVEAPVDVHEGSLLRYRLRLFGVRIDWLTRIAGWEPPRRCRSPGRSSPAGCAASSNTVRPRPLRS